MELGSIDAQVLSKWLADLRSGEFPQTKSNLRDATGFCCLGVLANQFADEWIGDPKYRQGCGQHISSSKNDDADSFSGFLGDDLMREIGLDCRLASDGMTMNDRKVALAPAGWAFVEA
jgi:hypothetical protein